VILRQNESTRSHALNARLGIAARSRLVLLGGGLPSKESTKNYRAPWRLSIKLQSIHKERRDLLLRNGRQGGRNSQTLSAGPIHAIFCVCPARVAEWQTLRT
jgi:hypothetical protein